MPTILALFEDEWTFL